MNDHQNRLSRLLGFLQADPDNISLMMDAADLAMQAGDWNQAKELVDRTLAIQPNDAVSRYRLAVILLHTGQPHDSVILTQTLVDAGETHPAVLFTHAQGLALTGRFEEAEPILTNLLPQADTFKEFPYLYIRVLHYLSKLDEALAYATSYAKVHPEDGGAQGMVSLLLLDNDDMAEAAKWSAKALENAPNNIDALVTAGSAALAYEDEGAAKRHFDKVLAIESGNGRAWAGKGLVSMLATDLDAAKAAFEKAVEHMPDHLGSYNVLAWIQIMQRDYDGAKVTLEKSLQVDATFGETHGCLAVIAAMQGRLEDAKREADIAVRLQPDSFAGQFARSLVLNHRGHPEKAQALIESIFTNFTVPGGGNLRDALQRYIVKHAR